MRALFVAAFMLLFFATHAVAEDFDCVITPSMILKLGSPVSSTLQFVSVNRGDVVHKGQEVARLESAAEEAAVALDAARSESLADVNQKQVKFNLAQIELNRGLKLTADVTIAPQKVDQLRAEFLVAQQDLAMAELDHDLAVLQLNHSKALLDQRTIRSPIDGIVTERTLGPGEYVRPESSIITVAATDPLYVDAYPPIAYWRQLHVGETATVRPDAAIGGSYPAKVLTIDHVFDAASGTFGIRLELPNPSGAIPAGMRCRVNFDEPLAAAP